MKDLIKNLTWFNLPNRLKEILGLMSESTGKGEKGDSPYDLYVKEGGTLSLADWLESLKGEKGDIGPIGGVGEKGNTGERGPEGPEGPRGADGRNFEIDGWINSIVDLPDATLNEGKTFGTRDLGHLHHSDGTQWINWGKFTGIKGDEGPRGPEGPEGPKGADGKDGKDADHQLPTGGDAGDILSKNFSGGLEWIKNQAPYGVYDLSIPNIGNTQSIKGVFDGNCDVTFERITSIMAKISVKYTRGQRAVMFYNSNRLSGNENRGIEKQVLKDEIWICDPDLIVNTFGEIATISSFQGDDVIEMHIRAKDNGKIKVWFHSLE